MMRLSIVNNQVLTSLDMRNNPGYEESTYAIREIERVVHTNESRAKPGVEDEEDYKDGYH